MDNHLSRTPFPERIRAMNERYDLPVNNTPTDLGVDRIGNFFDILMEEMRELNVVYNEAVTLRERADGILIDYDALECLVKLSDLLGDLTVYIRSEATKWGIPLEEVLDVIMDSNESKLDENGQPIKDSRGKFLKGPNFVPPEPRIRELLRSRMAETH